MKTNFDITHYQKELKQCLAEPISQSEIMLRASCSRKWFYRYVLKLDRRAVIDTNLIYGTLVHFWLEWLYKGGHQGTVEKDVGHASELPKMEFPQELLLSSERKTEIDLTVQKAWIQFKAYRQHYRDVDSYIGVRSNEQEYTVEFGGHKLIGKIDMVACPSNRDGVFIWDFKTAARLDRSVLDAWSFRFQFLFYQWLFWKATGEKPSGTMVNGIIKPAIRPKLADRKTKRMETRGDFLERYKTELQLEREKYFYRQRMPVKKGQLEWFEKEMLIPNLIPFTRMQRIHDFSSKTPSFVRAEMSADALAMNTNQCHLYNSLCEYLPLCKDGTIMLPEFSQRKDKHQELVKETDSDD